MSGYYTYKARKKSGAYRSVLIGGALSALSVVIFACVVAPGWTGSFGRAVHLRLIQFAGWSAWLIPVYLGWMGTRIVISDKDSRKVTDTMLFAVFFLSASSLLGVVSLLGAGRAAGLGGWIGERMCLFLVPQFGKFLVFIFSLVAAFVSGALALRLSPIQLLAALKEKIADDISQWKVEKAKMAEQQALRKKLDAADVKPSISVKTTAEKSMPKPAEKNVAEKEAPPARAVPPKIKSAGPAVPAAAGKAGGNGSGSGEPAVCDPYAGYVLPTADLLVVPQETVQVISKEELYDNGSRLEQTLEQFNVKAKVVDIHPGPVITRYDLSPAPGVRVQAIENLVDDIALSMKAQSLRVLAPIPGKAAVGIEISNPHPATVYFREVVTSSEYMKNMGEIPFALGKSTEGETFVADLASMPHLLVAGATGSGKSVSIHALILSILFRYSPMQVKLVLIDPKRLELPVYDGVPHLYDPACVAEEVKVVTQPKAVVQSLKMLVEVMEQRYVHFAKAGVRNIESYHDKSAQQALEPMPYIVVVIDELADLMITVGKEIEDVIQRLAQMARAVGIHLVLATQRPSVDVITGVIKANLPSRIAFQVLSKTDSRVILDSQGAEDLLGRGDMLYLSSGAPKPVRLHGSFVSESDVSRVVQFIKEQNFKPQYTVIQINENESSIVESEENRALLVRAARVVRDMEKVSGDLLRADKEIGSRYDLALTLLRKKGIIEKPKDSNRWKIHFEQLDEFLSQSDKPAQ